MKFFLTLSQTKCVSPVEVLLLTKMANSNNEFIVHLFVCRRLLESSHFISYLFYVVLGILEM